MNNHSRGNLPTPTSNHKVTIQPNKIVLSFDAELRDDSWARVAGELQSALTRKTPNAITVDFSKTTWADPIPLMTLILLLAEAKDREPKLNIISIFSRPTGRPSDRFLIFILSHGFLKTLTSISQIQIGDKHEFQDTALITLTSLIMQSAVTPLYVNSECIHMTLVPVVEIGRDGISTLVDSLIASARRIGIDQWMAGLASQADGYLYKLRQLLIEALDNIAEHAYPGRTGFGAIFARIRQGAPESPTEFLEWNRSRLAERKHCPTLHRNDVSRPPGWLELMICDIGCGLTNHLDVELSSKSPLANLANKLFRKSISRVQDRLGEGKTQLTGLEHMGFLLQGGTEQRGGFVRVYSSGEWLGEHHPWPEDKLQPAHTNFRKSLELVLSGTALHFALEPTTSGASIKGLKYPAYFYAPDYDNLSPIRAVLADTSEFPISKEPYHLIDLSAPSDGDFITTQRGLAFERRLLNRQPQTLIIRPFRVFRKADLLSQIIATIRHAPSVKQIIFADLLPDSAVDLAIVLRGQTIPTGSLQSVILLTQDWACSTFHIDISSRALREDEPDTPRARFFFKQNNTRIDAADIAEILRRADSELMWKTIDDTHSQTDIDSNAYLNETIVWSTLSGEQLQIDGYVDLPIAMSNPVAFECARRSIRRAVGAYKQSAILTADSVSSSFVGAEFFILDGTSTGPASNVSSPVVGVGSILVSGGTMSRMNKREDVEILGWVHLMRHAMSRSDLPSIYALLWKPSTKPPKPSRLKFERIAGSAFLIRGGESAVPLPRFEPPVDGKMGGSLYGESPDEMYGRWQRLQVLRMGHWTYGRHHDLLGVNLTRALEIEEIDVGTIVKWVSQYLADWSLEFGVDKTIVVYPRNRVTDRLVRLLKKLPDMPRFFPLEAVHSSSVSPLMISPVERDTLGRKLAKTFDNGGLLIQLDDGEISGRTMRDLRQLLDGLWTTLKQVHLVPIDAEVEIRSIALIDRRATPTQRSVVKRRMAKHPRLWRWDVPSLGEEGHCPLCSALDRCRDYVSRVPDGLCHDRLKQWTEDWKPVPVDQMTAGSGLAPKELPVGDYTRFGIERLSDGSIASHRVHHISSTSRTAVAMELCRSTTRKDYPIRKAKTGQLRNGEPMDLQIRIEMVTAQIFLFWSELSYLDRLERLEIVVNLLWESKEDTRATSLAALCLQIDSSMAPAVWKAIGLQVTERGFPNNDALLATIIVYSSLQNGSQKNYSELSGQKWDLFRIMRLPLSDLRQNLSSIFLILGSSRDTIHDGFLLNSLQSASVDEVRFRRVVSIIHALCNSLERLSPELSFGHDIDPTNDAKEIRHITDECLNHLQNNLVKKNALVPGTNALMAASAFRQSISDVFKRLFVHLYQGSNSLQRRYLEALTATIGIGERLNLILQEPHSSLLREWDKILLKKEDRRLRWASTPTPLLQFDGQRIDGKPLIIYCDAIVKRAIVEVLSNVVHASKMIPCPWSTDDQQLADMWGRVQKSNSDEFIIIELANSFDRSSDAGHARETLNSMHLKKIGGSIGTPSSNDGIYRTIISIPTLTGIVH